MRSLWTIAILLVSLSMEAQNPGGVSGNLRLWYKADAGTSSNVDNSQTYQWQDQSGNSFNAWVTGSPFFRNNATDNINYNPTIYLNGSSRFNLNDIGIRSSNYQYGNPKYDYTIIGVGIRDDNSANIIFGDNSNGGNLQTLSLGYSNNSTAIHTYSSQDLTISSSAYNTPALTPFLLVGEFDQNSGRRLAEFRNGGFLHNSDNQTNPMGRYAGHHVGYTAAGYGYFNGRISEVIIYRSNLSGLSELQVYTYLAIKYGISLQADNDLDGSTNEIIAGSIREGDYVASDGSTIIWNYSGQGSAYYNDIAGIGRDDNSGLLQKQAYSASADALVRIGLQSLEATNSANTASFGSDKSFLLWGNNNGNIAFTGNGAPPGRTILDRKWRVQETGSVGSVRISIPAQSSSAPQKLPSAGTLSFLVDSDGDFSSGATEYDMTLVGNDWVIDIDLSSGQYFTVAPGGAELSVTTQGKESGPVNIVLTLLLPDVNNTGAPFTFDLSDNYSGSANSGLDYQAIPPGAQISVPAGSSSATYVIAVIDDLLPESTENIDLSISNPSGPEFFISSGDVTASIQDDDAGPGGIGNALNVWLKADAGTSTTQNNAALNSWSDQSSAGHDALADGAPPVFKNNTVDNINFYPSIFFDGQNDRLTLNLNDIKSGQGNGGGKYSIFGIGMREDGDRNYLLGSEGGQYQQELFFGYENNTQARLDNVGSSLNLSVGAYNAPQLLPFLLYGQFYGSGRVFEEFRNGSFVRGSDSYATAIQGNRANYIGDIASYSAHYHGRISEIIVYDVDITEQQKQQVQSYLALKYGLMLTNNSDGDGTPNEWIVGNIYEGDYVGSDGNIIWSYSGQGATYYNDVAGIGRDDASSLLHKQSQSANADRLLTIGLGEISDANADNPYSFAADRTFLLWGNNNGALNFSSTGAPANREILQRSWRVARHGMVDSVLLRIPASNSSQSYKLPPASGLDLLIDDDGNFSNGSRLVSMSLNGTFWEAKTTFADGEYFSFSPKGTDLTVAVHGKENGPVNIVLNVSLPEINNSGAAVTFTLTDQLSGSAVSGLDYTAIAPNTTISIPQGSQSASYIVGVIDDALAEGPETVDFSISNPSNPAYFVGIGEATAQILDNDAGPGGVGANLNIWLRADRGTSGSVHNSSLHNWEDQSPNGKDAPAALYAPKIGHSASVNINFNPVILFDGIDDRMQLDLSDLLLGNGNGGGKYTIIALGRRESGGRNYFIGSDAIQANEGLHLGYENNGTSAILDHYANSLLLSGLNAHNSPALSTVLMYGEFRGNSRRIEEIRDQQMSRATDANTTAISGSANHFLGFSDSYSTPFNGRIAELIVYDENISDLQKLQIYSYLSLKYGLQPTADLNGNGTTNEGISGGIREGDFLASDGQTILWNYALQGAAFYNDLSGIGRDDASYLNQKQSRAESSDALVTIALQNVAATNQANTGSFTADKTFLIWGNDNGSLNFSLQGAPENYKVLGRKWKVQETGESGTTKVRVPAHNSSQTIKIPQTSNLRLLIDSDGDFSNGATVIPMNLNGTNWEGSANFPDGYYFTFATEGCTFSLTTQGSENGPQHIVFTLQLPVLNSSGTAFTFDVIDNLNGTASAGSDYTALAAGAKISVPHNSQSATFTINVLDDALAEGLENLEIRLSNPSGPWFFCSQDTVQANILDNDIGPGAAGNNLVAWLRADQGIFLSNGALLNLWTDQSSSVNNGVSDGSPPTFRNNATDNHNYNSTVFFDGLNDRLQIDLSDIRNSNYTLIAVGERQASGYQMVLGSEGGGTNDELQFGYRTDNQATLSHSQYSGHLNLSGLNSYNIPQASPFLLSASLSGSLRSISELRDGIGSRTTDGNVQALSGSKINYIGDYQFTANYQGFISEIIVYQSTLSSLEKLKIDSYLALKYGLQLSADLNFNSTLNEVVSGTIREGDYIASDGQTIIWNYNGQSAAYYHDIAGIGRDDGTGLQQKQSRSESSDGLLSMGLGSIYATNSLNVNTFPADKSFLLWGNNNAALTFSTVNSPAAGRKISRIWRVQEVGNIGNVRMQVPASSSSQSVKLPAADHLFLLVDADGDFSTGATSHAMTLVNNNWELSLDFSSGQYFSFYQAGAVLSTSSHGSEDGPQPIVFSLTLGAVNNSGSPISFDITDNGSGSATAGLDYTSIPAGAKITIPPGSQTGSYTVNVLSDALAEGQETVGVSVSNPSLPSVFLLQNSASGIIENYTPPAQYPGGVSNNLVFWLRADSATNTTTDGATVNAWSDISGNGNNASGLGNAPVFRQRLSNFNPALDFVSSSGGLSLANNASINASSSSAKSYSLVFRTGGDIQTRQMIYEEGGGTHGMNTYLNGGLLYVNFWVSNTDYTGSITIAAHRTYLLTFIYSGSANQWQAYLNGSLLATVGGVPANFPSHTGGIGIGVINNSTQYSGGVDVSSGDAFAGYVMEMAYYNALSFSGGQRNQLESYLALKYGISLPENYTGSDGSSLYWNATQNAPHSAEVLGLGRDDGGGLNQKQAHSADSLLIIALGSIATTNKLNAQLFSQDKSSIMLAHQQGSLSGMPDNTKLLPESGEVDRLQRHWKVVDYTGVSTVQIAFEQSRADQYLSAFGDIGVPYLRIAADSLFQSNVVDLPLSLSTVFGNAYYTAAYNFGNASFMTLILKEAIVWDGNYWRGGESNITAHAPSDNASDQLKNMDIRSGDTARLQEAVHITDLSIQTNAVLQIIAPNCLRVEGNLTNHGDLFISAGAAGYSQYHGPSTAAHFQQYVDHAGWHLIGSPFADASFDDITFPDGNGFINHPVSGLSQDSCIYCNLWYYDPALDRGSNIGFGGSNAFGSWRSSSDGTQLFDPHKGWNLYLDENAGFAQSPWLLQISGNLNDGALQQSANENNGGWNLMANPYASALNWDVVDDDLAAAGFALAYYIWDEENANFATYALGSGTLGAGALIAPFQGFFVQTAQAGGQNSGDVLRSFELDNNDRAGACLTANDFYKQSLQPEIKLQLTQTSSGYRDETVLRFVDGASPDFQSAEDARKLFSANKQSVSLYSRAGSSRIAINSHPFMQEGDSVVIALRAPDDLPLQLSIIENSAGPNFLIEDRWRGSFHEAGELVEFRHITGLEERFLLHYASEADLLQHRQYGINAYIDESGHLVIAKGRRPMQAKWELTALSGSVVSRGDIHYSDGSKVYIDISSLQSGVYILHISGRGMSHTQKIPLIR